MELITNFDNRNHQKHIEILLADASEVYIAVAFLKLSGWYKLQNSLKKLARNKCKITLVAGQNFAITEPKALAAILQLSNEHPSVKAFLFKMGKRGESFHPKIYATVRDDSFRLLTGSANLTSGGLSTNFEASTLLAGKTSERIWMDVKDFFATMTKPSNSSPVDDLIIRDYSLFYNKAKAERGKRDFEIDPTPEEFEINLKKVRTGFTTKIKKELAEALLDKEKKYRRAKKVLTEIALLEKPEKKQFLDLFLQLTNNPEGNLFYSGGIDRHKNDYEKGFKQLHKIIQSIHASHRKPASVVFRQAMELAQNVEGVSVNLVTEIMTAFDYRRFTVLNVRPITALKEISSKSLKKTSRLFTGDEYQDFCERMIDLTKKLGLQNLLETDLFCSSFYEVIQQKLNSEE